MIIAVANVCMLVSLSMSGGGANADGAPAPVTRVYVFTAEGTPGHATDEEKGRLEAVHELRDALAKKKELQLVTDRADAEVIVEVVDREERQTGEGGFGGKLITKMGDTIIRVRVSHASGGEPSELKGMGQGNWARAAKDAADRIVKWVERDRPAPQKRGKDKPPSTVMTLPVA